MGVPEGKGREGGRDRGGGGEEIGGGPQGEGVVAEYLVWRRRGCKSYEEGVQTCEEESYNAVVLWKTL